MNRVTDKLTPVTDRIYCCRSGSAADTQCIADIVKYNLDMIRCVVCVCVCVFVMCGLCETCDCYRANPCSELGSLGVWIHVHVDQCKFDVHLN